MDQTYETIAKLLKRSAKKHGLTLTDAVWKSQAKTPKIQLHVYGNKEVKIGKRPLQPTYLVGLMQHTSSVSFYSMAVAAFPSEFALSPRLKKALKGKSCFQLKEIDKELATEIAAITEKNIAIFKREGWI